MDSSKTQLLRNHCKRYVILRRTQNYLRFTATTIEYATATQSNHRELACLLYFARACNRHWHHTNRSKEHEWLMKQEEESYNISDIREPRAFNTEDEETLALQKKALADIEAMCSLLETEMAGIIQALESEGQHDLFPLGMRRNASGLALQVDPANHPWLQPEDLDSSLFKVVLPEDVSQSTTDSE